jgi:hypothetical protein
MKIRIRKEKDQGRHGNLSTPRPYKDMNDRIEEAEKRVREFLEDKEAVKAPTSRPCHQ